jgi:hypothetical protein
LSPSEEGIGSDSFHVSINCEQGGKNMKSRFALWVGVLALVCEVMGTRFQAQAADKTKKLTDLQCTAGQFPLFDGTQ